MIESPRTRPSNGGIPAPSSACTAPMGPAAEDCRGLACRLACRLGPVDPVSLSAQSSSDCQSYFTLCHITHYVYISYFTHFILHITCTFHERPIQQRLPGILKSQRYRQCIWCVEDRLKTPSDTNCLQHRIVCCILHVHLMRDIRCILSCISHVHFI
jgi:hypothetical protein